MYLKWFFQFSLNHRFLTASKETEGRLPDLYKCEESFDKQSECTASSISLSGQSLSGMPYISVKNGTTTVSWLAVYSILYLIL